MEISGNRITSGSERGVMGMPLTLVKEGTEASIVRVGGKEEVRRHLENMGFVPGASVTVVSANNGNVIVNVKESRVAISKEMANKIMV